MISNSIRFQKEINISSQFPVRFRTEKQRFGALFHQKYPQRMKLSVVN